MSETTASNSDLCKGLAPADEHYAVGVVDRILQAAMRAQASDIHLEQLPGTILVRLRVAGSLIELATIPDGTSAKILSRVKAMARLITYRADIPQEGRIGLAERGLEARVSTLPTIHGERAVIRLASRNAESWLPPQLGLSESVLRCFQAALDRPSGVILISGTAGSGKTTTAYAGLRYLGQSSREPRSLVALEDPIESEIAGVSQSQINPSVGFGWTEGLKALLRQDPEVMFVGEIRDSETARVVFQAAMMGQLVITTLHARSAADALKRLMDLDVPAQHVVSGLEALLCQRLIRSNCSACPPRSTGQTNCSVCGGSGFSQRMLLAEHLPVIEDALSRAIVTGADTSQLASMATQQGMIPLASLGEQLVEAGRLDPLELKRYL